MPRAHVHNLILCGLDDPFDRSVRLPTRYWGRPQADHLSIRWFAWAQEERSRLDDFDDSKRFKNDLNRCAIFVCLECCCFCWHWPWLASGPVFLSAFVGRLLVVDSSLFSSKLVSMFLSQLVFFSRKSKPPRWAKKPGAWLWSTAQPFVFRWTRFRVPKTPRVKIFSGAEEGESGWTNEVWRKAHVKRLMFLCFPIRFKRPLGASFRLRSVISFVRRSSSCRFCLPTKPWVWGSLVTAVPLSFQTLHHRGSKWIAPGCAPELYAKWPMSWRHVLREGQPGIGVPQKEDRKRRKWWWLVGWRGWVGWLGRVGHVKWSGEVTVIWHMSYLAHCMKCCRWSSCSIRLHCTSKLVGASPRVEVSLQFMSNGSWWFLSLTIHTKRVHDDTETLVSQCFMNLLVQKH